MLVGLRRCEEVKIFQECLTLLSVMQPRMKQLIIKEVDNIQCNIYNGNSEAHWGKVILFCQS